MVAIERWLEQQVQAYLEDQPKGWKLPALLISYRIGCALLMCTSFVPDEYWQANEIGHWMAFGYGYRTWEWQQGLRGFFHPAVLVGLADLSIMKLARKWFGTQVAVMTLLASVFSWFIAYCGVRTLSSSMEAALSISMFVNITMVAKDSYEKYSEEDAVGTGPRIITNTKRARFGWVLAAASCLVRPTAGIMWISIGVVHMLQSHSWKRSILSILPIAAAALFVSLILDYWWYGTLTVVQLNFLRFNVLTEGANYYGIHPWYWYFVQGLPVVYGLLYFILLIGLGLQLIYGYGLPHPRWPIIISVIYVTVFSCLRHKEFRFVFPTIYLILPHCGYVLHLCQITLQPLLFDFCLDINECVVYYLWSGYDIYNARASSRPGSHLHRNINMRFPGCPPPGLGEPESDRLHADPLTWLQEFEASVTLLPSFVVAYKDVLGTRAYPWLHRHAYEAVHCVNHAHFPQSDRDGNIFCVYSRIKLD
eukprot:gene6444-297_t